MIARLTRSLVCAALAAAVVACGSSGKKAPGGGPVGGGPTGGGPVAGKQVTLAEVGLEAASLDRTADPCGDFYQFACGGWLAANEIPPDRARWARFSEITVRNEQALKDILDGLAAAPGDDPVNQRLGDFYGSCTDEAAIEKRGMAGIKPLLDVIGKVKDVRTLQAAIAELHRHQVYVAWAPAVEADLADSTTNILYLDSAGLGLPDRDFYFKDEFAAARSAYLEHLTRLFGLLGKGKASAQLAKDVMALETKLAEKTKTGVERRNVPAMYNPTDIAALTKAAAGIDWKTYFGALGNAEPGKLSVTTPPYFAALPTLLKSVKAETWKAYLTAHLVDQSSMALPKAFDDEAFKLQQALSGVQQQKDRWRRCVDAVSAAMPEYLGQPYVAKYFPGASKDEAKRLIGAIASVMNEQMGTLDWMSAETKVQARGKLSKIEALIGYPDTWKTYDYAVDRADFAGNSLRAAAFEGKRNFLKAGKPYDRSEWLMPAFLVNAYYNPLANNTGLPAGILQRPFFAADRSIAANLGGIGMVVGHELTHGFDDQGAQFDAQGNLKNWWQPADLEKFQAKGQCLAKQYSTFETLPGKNVNGELTLGENIADIGGIKHAFLAYRSLRAGAAEPVIADGFTEDQQFFLAVGQAWCSKDRPEEALKRLTDDVHSPPKWRVNGSLRNLPQFAEAFGCKRGQPMAPAEMCTVW